MTSVGRLSAALVLVTAMIIVSGENDEKAFESYHQPPQVPFRRWDPEQAVTEATQRAQEVPRLFA